MACSALSAQDQIQDSDPKNCIVKCLYLMMDEDSKKPTNANNNNYSEKNSFNDKKGLNTNLNGTNSDSELENKSASMSIIDALTLGRMASKTKSDQASTSSASVSNSVMEKDQDVLNATRSKPNLPSVKSSSKSGAKSKSSDTSSSLDKVSISRSAFMINVLVLAAYFVLQ